MNWGIGIRAHDYGRMPLAELAARISADGFSYIQLALAKAISDFDFSYGKLSSGLAATINRELNKNDLRVSVLGCYINPIQEDEEQLQHSIRVFKEHIRFAKEIGTKIVATETGNVVPAQGMDMNAAREKAFQRFMRFMEEVIAEAEKFGVFVTIESVHCDTISGPKAMRKMFDSIKSYHVAALVDWTNMVSPEKVESAKTLVDESFEFYADRINAFHIKDIAMDAGKISRSKIGEGSLDLPYLFQKIKQEKPFCDIILEDTRPEELKDVVSYMRRYF